MTLILNNDDVKQVLTMKITMNALDQAYRELTRREAVCRPRIDVQIPTKDSTTKLPCPSCVMCATLIGAGSVIAPVAACPVPWTTIGRDVAAGVCGLPPIVGNGGA